MAETIKKANDNAKKRVLVKIPRNKGQNANQQEFFSVNGRNYLIERGVEVEVPAEIEEVIENAEKAEEYALHYAEGLVRAEKDKRKELEL